MANPGINELLKLLVPSKEPTETVVVNVAPASAYDSGYCAPITPDLFISIGQEIRANPDIIKAVRSMKDEQDQFESRLYTHYGPNDKLSHQDLLKILTKWDNMLEKQSFALKSLFKNSNFFGPTRNYEYIAKQKRLLELLCEMSL